MRQIFFFFVGAHQNFFNEDKNQLKVENSVSVLVSQAALFELCQIGPLPVLCGGARGTISPPSLAAELPSNRNVESRSLRKR